MFDKISVIHFKMFTYFKFILSQVFGQLGRKMWKLAIILSIALTVSAYPADLKYDEAEELEHEFQGDMIISQQELDAFNGLITETTKWPNNIVPYTVNPSHFSKKFLQSSAFPGLNLVHCSFQMPSRSHTSIMPLVWSMIFTAWQWSTAPLKQTTLNSMEIQLDVLHTLDVEGARRSSDSHQIILKLVASVA